MVALPGPEPTPASVAYTLHSAFLMCLATRKLLYHLPDSGDDLDEVLVALGEMVRQTERLVVEAQEGFDLLCSRGKIVPKAEGSP